MSVIDITILKSVSPITVLDKPSKKTIEFLAKLTQEATFKTYFESVRELNNFPKNGLPIKEFI